MQWTNDQSIFRYELRTRQAYDHPQPQRLNSPGTNPILPGPKVTSPQNQTMSPGSWQHFQNRTSQHGFMGRAPNKATSPHHAKDTFERLFSPQLSPAKPMRRPKVNTQSPPPTNFSPRRKGSGVFSPSAKDTPQGTTYISSFQQKSSKQINDEKQKGQKKLISYAHKESQKITDSRPSHKKSSGNAMIKGKHVSDPQNIIANDQKPRYATSYKSEITQEHKAQDGLTQERKKEQQRGGKMFFNGKPKKNVSDLPT